MGVVPQFEGYSLNAFETQSNLQRYTAQYGATIRQFADSTLAELRSMGFSVQILATPEEQCNPAAGCYDSVGYSVMLTRDGITQQHTVGDRGQATRFDSAREAAAYISRIFWQNAPSLQQDPTTQNSYGYVQQQAPITPTASTTLPATETIQPMQAPPAPEQSGTVGGSAGGSVPPPTESTQSTTITRTFDEWNWYYRQKTGQIPPAPETVGFPTSRRSEQISYQEWSQYTAAWFAAQAMPPASVVFDQAEIPAGGSGSSTPSGVDYFTLIAAVLALLGVR